MMNLFKHFSKTQPDAHKIAQLYGKVMAQARDKEFFIRYGLSDDFETRYESLILHMFLVMRYITPECHAIKQGLIDFMVSDLDRTLREMGVGDVGVVKRMKTFMENYYGHVNAYEAAMASADDKEILRALDRNLYGATSTDLAKLELMREYIRMQSTTLSAHTPAQINAGELVFKNHEV